MRQGNAGFSWIMLLIALLGLPTWAQAARVRVGIFEFSGVGDRYERQTASSRLAKTLVDLGRFDVIERERLDQIMREQRFQQSYPVDQTTAVETGRIAGIDVVFLGQIDNLDTKWTSVQDAPGFYRGTASVSIKVTDVQSGRLMKVITVKGTGTGDRREEARIAALGACFERSLVESLKEVFSLEGRVTRVQGDVVYLQLGREEGIRVGQRFTLMRSEAEGSWDTGYRGSFMREVGLIQISSVTSSMAKGKVIWSKTQPVVGDVLLEVADPRYWVTGLGLKAANVRISGRDFASVEDTVGIWRWRIGTELPFRGETGLELLFASSVDSVAWSGIGGYGSIEVPVIPGTLDGVFEGAIGLGLARQPYYGYPGSVWTIPSSGSARGTGLYLRGGAGLRMYLAPQRGLRLELGTCLYGGPIITEWSVHRENKATYDVTRYVDYPDFRVSGLSLTAGASVAF